MFSNYMIQLKMCIVVYKEGVFVRCQNFKVKITYNSFADISSNKKVIMANHIYTFTW